jgi:hypothetical protein
MGEKNRERLYTAYELIPRTFKSANSMEKPCVDFRRRLRRNCG